MIRSVVPPPAMIGRGGHPDENCADRAADRKRSSHILRRHRADRRLPLGRAGPPGPRGDPVRERRFAHRRRAGAVHGARAPAEPGGTRSAAPLHAPARARAAPGARVRRPALPYRLSPLSAVPGAGRQHAHHLPRPPGSARPARGPARVSRVPAGVDLRPSAAPVPGLALDRHRAPRPARRALPVLARRPRRLSGLPRPDLPGEAARPGDRDRPPRRPSAQDRGQGRSRRSGLFR
jgi:hypothetical protein